MCNVDAYVAPYTEAERLFAIMLMLGWVIKPGHLCGHLCVETWP